jgi:hypothetical protein
MFYISDSMTVERILHSFLRPGASDMVVIENINVLWITALGKTLDIAPRFFALHACNSQSVTRGNWEIPGSQSCWSPRTYTTLAAQKSRDMYLNVDANYEFQLSQRIRGSEVRHKHNFFPCPIFDEVGNPTFMTTKLSYAWLHDVRFCKCAVLVLPSRWDLVLTKGVQ